MKELENVIGIYETNSVDFIKTIYRYFNERIPVAVIRDETAANISINFTEIVKPLTGGGWLEIEQTTIKYDSLAQVVFTSGTEGKPKGILLNYKTLANTVARLNKVMGIDSSIKEYIGVPVHYSFGFGRCRAVIAAGGSAYIPDAGFNPVEIRKMLENDSINAISAVPTLWRMILDNEDVIGKQGEKVKWIEIGSQYMSADEKQKMILLFPNATIVQHYGLTEASRSTFLVINKTPAQYLESVGQAIEGVELQISSEGKVKIRGEHTADGILKNNVISPLTDDDGWLKTNDLGHIDNGYLYYDGRSDDLINCGGIKVNPDIIQSKLEQRLKISNKIAISQYPCKIRGEGFLIAVLQDYKIDEGIIIEQLVNLLDEFSISARSSIRVIYLDNFPTTQTGKIQRKKISKMFQGDNHVSEISQPREYEGIFYSEFAKIFPGEKINPDSSFTDMGGDSLNYVQISMLLEEKLGYLPANWENTEIEKLSLLKPLEKPYFSEVDSSIVLRVLAIFAVVLTHAGFNYAGGGTLLLFMLIGFNMGRFKHKEFTQSGSWKWFGNYAIKILIPYFALAVLLMLREKDLDMTTVFLVTNLIELKLTVAFPFWFVQVLLQSILILSIMFSFQFVRTKLQKHPWETALFILSIFLLIRITYPLIWDTSYLRNLVPQRFVMLMWLGYCFSFLSTTKQKILMVIIGIVTAYLDVGASFTIHWIIIGSMVLAFLPNIKLPDISKKPINIIANSTFYIFIFNGVVLTVLFRIPGLDSRIVLTAITMAACILIWKVSEYLNLENRLLQYIHRLKAH